MAESNANNKIKFTGYGDKTYKSTIIGEMTLRFNPTTVSHGHSIEYNGKSSPNTIAPQAKFKNVGPENISFEILFDGTGMVDGQEMTVTKQIEMFKKITYNYQGDKHETPYVNVSFGKFLNFNGRLKSLDIKYTHFDPTTAAPTRAKASVSFSNSMDANTEAKTKEQNSPDLTHMRMVRAGDTLPLMCQNIYGDSSMYLHVARVNGLTDFRNLKPGSELTFPPIK